MNNINSNKKELSPEQREELLRALKARFEKNMNRHKGLEWAKVQAKLEANPEKLWSLNEMERTGGEPDVVGHDKKTGEYIFYDCSAESPKGRRSVCYDREALESRKEHKPENNAMDMAAAMGIELLTEEQYRELQKLGNFDTKTSSWVKTPSDIRKLGGAIFCDRRYDTCLCVSQRCRLLLCRQGVPWLAKGLNFAQTAKWGVLCYTFQKGHILVISGLKEYYALRIFKGALLNDANDILIKPGENTQAAALVEAVVVYHVHKNQMRANPASNGRG